MRGTSNPMETTVTNTPHEGAINRRSLVKGAAWSLPVIATAVAAPLASASGEDTATSVGSLVESSDNIKSTTLSASSSRVEACFPNDSFSTSFNLTATVTYDGASQAFSLAGSTVASAGNVWTIVSRTANLVTLTATQTVTCYVGITGFELEYHNPDGSYAPLDSITLNISGVSTDGTRKIDGLVSAIRGYGPVVGPRVNDA